MGKSKRNHKQLRAWRIKNKPAVLPAHVRPIVELIFAREARITPCYFNEMYFKQRACFIFQEEGIRERYYKTKEFLESCSDFIDCGGTLWSMREQPNAGAASSDWPGPTNGTDTSTSSSAPIPSSAMAASTHGDSLTHSPQLSNQASATSSSIRESSASAGEASSSVPGDAAATSARSLLSEPDTSISDALSSRNPYTPILPMGNPQAESHCGDAATPDVNTAARARSSVSAPTLPIAPSALASSTSRAPSSAAKSNTAARAPTSPTTPSAPASSTSQTPSTTTNLNTVALTLPTPSNVPLSSATASSNSRTLSGVFNLNTAALTSSLFNVPNPPTAPSASVSAGRHSQSSSLDANASATASSHTSVPPLPPTAPLARTSGVAPISSAPIDKDDGSDVKMGDADGTPAALNSHATSKKTRLRKHSRSVSASQLLSNLSSLNLNAAGGGGGSGSRCDMSSEPGPRAKVRHTQPRVPYAQEIQTAVRNRPRRSRSDVGDLKSGHLSTPVRMFGGDAEKQSFEPSPPAYATHTRQEFDMRDSPPSMPALSSNAAVDGGNTAAAQASFSPAIRAPEFMSDTPPLPSPPPVSNHSSSDGDRGPSDSDAASEPSSTTRSSCDSPPPLFKPGKQEVLDEPLPLPNGVTTTGGVVAARGVAGMGGALPSNGVTTTDGPLAAASGMMSVGMVGGDLAAAGVALKDDSTSNGIAPTSLGAPAVSGAAISMSVSSSVVETEQKPVLHVAQTPDAHVPPPQAHRPPPPPLLPRTPDTSSPDYYLISEEAELSIDAFNAYGVKLDEKAPLFVYSPIFGMHRSPLAPGRIFERDWRTTEIEQELRKLQLVRWLAYVPCRPPTPTERRGVISGKKWGEFIDFCSRHDTPEFVSENNFDLYGSMTSPEGVNHAFGGAINIAFVAAMGDNKSGIAVIRPPGHHQQMHEANGFCWLNNAVGATLKRLAMSLPGDERRIMSTAVGAGWNAGYGATLKRLAMPLPGGGDPVVCTIDFDGHAGQGVTEAAARHVAEEADEKIRDEDAAVTDAKAANGGKTAPRWFAFDLHRDTAGGFFPGPLYGGYMDVGEHNNIYNLPLPPGAGDLQYIWMFFDVVVPAILNIAPDGLHMPIGLDAHHLDPLVKLNMTYSGYIFLYEIILACSKSEKVERIGYLEGGYDRNVLRELIPSLFKVLLNQPVAHPRVYSSFRLAGESAREKRSFRRMSYEERVDALTKKEVAFSAHLDSMVDFFQKKGMLNTTSKVYQDIQTVAHKYFPRPGRDNTGYDQCRRVILGKWCDELGRVAPEVRYHPPKHLKSFEFHRAVFRELNLPGAPTGTGKREDSLYFDKSATTAPLPTDSATSGGELSEDTAESASPPLESSSSSKATPGNGQRVRHRRAQSFHAPGSGTSTSSSFSATPARARAHSTSSMSNGMASRHTGMRVQTPAPTAPTRASKRLKERTAKMDAANMYATSSQRHDAVASDEPVAGTRSRGSSVSSTSSATRYATSSQCHGTAGTRSRGSSVSSTSSSALCATSLQCHGTAGTRSRGSSVSSTASTARYATSSQSHGTAGTRSRGSSVSSTSSVARYAASSQCHDTAGTRSRGSSVSSTSSAGSTTSVLPGRAQASHSHRRSPSGQGTKRKLAEAPAPSDETPQRVPSPVEAEVAPLGDTPRRRRHSLFHKRPKICVDDDASFAITQNVGSTSAPSTPSHAPMALATPRRTMATGAPLLPQPPVAGSLGSMPKTASTPGTPHVPTHRVPASMGAGAGALAPPTRAQREQPPLVPEPLPGNLLPFPPLLPFNFLTMPIGDITGEDSMVDVEFTAGANGATGALATHNFAPTSPKFQPNTSSVGSHMLPTNQPLTVAPLEQPRPMPSCGRRDPISRSRFNFEYTAFADISEMTPPPPPPDFPFALPSPANSDFSSLPTPTSTPGATPASSPTAAPRLRATNTLASVLPQEQQ